MKIVKIGPGTAKIWWTEKITRMLAIKVQLNVP